MDSGLLVSIMFWYGLLIETVDNMNAVIHFYPSYYILPSKAELSMEDSKLAGIKNPEKRAKAAYVTTLFS